jgi:hypothetical protein
MHLHKDLRTWLRDEEATCSTKVQQPHRRLPHLIDPQQPRDLPQQLPPTTVPVVRIEGVRGSNPLSSTQVSPYMTHGPSLQEPSCVRLVVLGAECSLTDRHVARTQSRV